jgi:hypothetical protein
MPSVYSCEKKCGHQLECLYDLRRFAVPIGQRKNTMQSLRKMAVKRLYPSVRLECPTIPNIRMLHEKNAISGAIQEWERTGVSPTRLGLYLDGFCGISLPLESLLQIISADLVFKLPRPQCTCQACRLRTRGGGARRHSSYGLHGHEATSCA